MSSGVNINQVITELAIVLAKDLPLTNIIEKYGNETVGEAMQFIIYEKQEKIAELEEDELWIDYQKNGL